MFPALARDDVRFAQDCLGDQYLLRDGLTWRLDGETGEIETMGLSLREFVRRSLEDPVEFLRLQPLLAFERGGGKLLPGQLLSVYPPYVVKHDGERSFRAIPADDRVGFLADLARQLAGLPDGTEVRFVVGRP